MAGSTQPRPGGRRRRTVVLPLAVALAIAGCSSSTKAGGEEPSRGESVPKTAPQAMLALGETEPTPPGPPPPLPQTECLPKTPVELDFGPYVRVCALNPFTWELTNISSTVLHIAMEPGVSFQHLRGGPPGPDRAKETVKELVSTRYRKTYPDGYWVQPEDTVQVTWAGEPGIMRYTPVPDESAAVAVTLAIADDTVLDFDRPGKTANDWQECLAGAASMAHRVFTQTEYTQAAWNQVIDDGLTVVGCRELQTSRDEATRLAPELQRTTRGTFAEILPNIGRWLQVAAKGARRGG